MSWRSPCKCKHLDVRRLGQCGVSGSRGTVSRDVLGWRFDAGLVGDIHPSVHECLAAKALHVFSSLFQAILGIDTNAYVIVVTYVGTDFGFGLYVVGISN